MEAFWGQVRTNLQAGRVRLLFVADRVPPELRRVVEFLNRQMQPAEVLAIELRQYEGQGLKTLVPRSCSGRRRILRRRRVAARSDRSRHGRGMRHPSSRRLRPTAMRQAWPPRRR